MQFIVAWQPYKLICLGITGCPIFPYLGQKCHLSKKILHFWKCCDFQFFSPFLLEIWQPVRDYSLRLSRILSQKLHVPQLNYIVFKDSMIRKNFTTTCWHIIDQKLTGDNGWRRHSLGHTMSLKECHLEMWMCPHFSSRMGKSSCLYSQTVW